MRPQHITAENMKLTNIGSFILVASMRPQHITAENLTAPQSAGGQPTCFNEAAAYHCGKLTWREISDPGLEASMRPQHITAENRARLRE